ncbi:B3 domain-containing transcription factor VRN1-like [Silene latifolia]|uniref:B3 domain-containing transcription factor VRN1-like n=1 Tax=Silene latifolia TaxID=37657 RepID=UPI003D78473C
MGSSPERKFFRLMVTPTFSSNKLMIPKVFASKYYKEFGEYFYLEVPTGVTHRVELAAEDDELWFGNGIEKFMDAFSIKYGYFLVFIYQGDSNFRVHIYDLTACEIFYERSHDDSSLEASCEVLGSETDVGVSSPGSELQDEMLDSESGSESSNGSIIVRFNAFPYSIYPWLNQCGDKVRALADARIPVPNNPFFVTSIQKCNFDRCSMAIPCSFARAHLRCRSGSFVRVKVDDGRQWSIQCYRNRSRCILCHGWSDMAQEMNLEIGDVFLFELTDVKKSVFRLFVLKAS